MKKETNMRTFVKAIVVIGVMAMVAAPASAWTITVTSAAATATGFTTYTFEITPDGGKTISSAEGDFQATVMRQVNPFTLASVFEDANGAMGGVAENPDSDSQFEFHTTIPDTLLIAAQSESATNLTAAFTSFAVKTSVFNLAHIVLPSDGLASYDILMVEDNEEIRQTGEFGIPEPATMLVLLGGGLLAVIRRR